MNKYNKNRTQIGDEEIESTKNFGKLMGAYNTIIPTTKPKLYNKSLLWSAAASIIAVVGIIAYNYIKTDAALAATKAFITPPIAGVNVPDTTLKINAETGGTIILPSGSIIEIPANAFVNLDGSAIKGIVDLKYREFRKPTEFFVSGIPMTYDSAGTKYTFESAGMFDLNGLSGNKAIKIAEGKSLNVKMSSIYKEDRYNKYILDTITKTWVYLGKSEIEKSLAKDSSLTMAEMPVYSEEDGSLTDITTPAAMSDAESKEYIKTKRELAALVLVKPKMRDEKAYTKILTIPKGRFPELEAISGTKVMFDLSSVYAFSSKKLPDSAYSINHIERSKARLGYYRIALVYYPEIRSDPSFFVSDFAPVFDEAAFNKYKTIKKEYAAKLKALETGSLATTTKEIKPAKPAKAESMKNTFKLEVDPNQFPEIAVYKDVLFEIPLAQFNKLPANFDKPDFEDVKIARSSKEGYYNFTLVKPCAGTEPQVYKLTDCRPVFTGTDYDEAVKTYNTLYTKYENRYKGKVLQQERDQKKLADDEAKANEAYAKYEVSRAEFAKRQAEAWEKQNKASYIQSIGYRAFQVREFGMYNSDCPNNMPKGAIVLASVTDDNGKTITYNSLYMVDHGRNALYTIYCNNGKANLSYNPESSTTFWVVTNDGKIAMLDTEAVKKLNPKKEGINQLTFAMHVSEKDLKTENEIAEFLNLN